VIVVVSVFICPGAPGSVANFFSKLTARGRKTAVRAAFGETAEKVVEQVSNLLVSASLIEPRMEADQRG
jgi:hypothetical protein